MTSLDANVPGVETGPIVREEYNMWTNTLKVWLRKDIKNSVLRKVCQDLRTGNAMRNAYHVAVDYRARVITARELLGTQINDFVAWLRDSFRKFLYLRKHPVQSQALSSVEHDEAHPSVEHNRHPSYVNAPQRHRRRTLALARAA